MKIIRKNKLKYKYNAFIFLLIINTLNISIISNHIIVPLIKDMNCYYIKIFIDAEKKKPEFIKINMALDFTFIPLSYNISSKIENKIYIENEIVEVDNNEYNSKLISTNYFFLEEDNNININNFRFYYINKKDLNKDDINKNNYIYNSLFYGQFGLSPIYDDNNLNILYILKEQNIINQISFSIYFNKSNSYLFLGEIEENKNNLIDGKKNAHIINLDKKLLKKYNKWGVKIDALVVEKKNELIKHTKHKYFAYFNIIEDRIFVPDKIMEYLKTRIFKNYIKNGICFITEYNDKKFINCKKNKMIGEKENFPSIIFVIKKFGFKLNYEDLFIDSLKENELIFIIQKNYYDVDTSIILFGSRFFKKYLIEFNLEKNNIIFHSDKIIPLVNLEDIEDDFWKDLVRDYNKETEHYDSNYGDDEKSNDKDNNINDNNDINDIGDKNKDNNYKKSMEDKEEESENKENEIKNGNNRKIKIEFEYNILFKLIFIILFIIAIFIGICAFIRFRKNIRIENEKKYFNQPLNKENDNKE